MLRYINHEMLVPLTQYRAHSVELRAFLRRFLGRNCVHNFHFRLRDAIALARIDFLRAVKFSISKTALGFCYEAIGFSFEVRRSSFVSKHLASILNRLAKVL